MIEGFALNHGSVRTINLLTNHALVLILLARNNTLRMRDIASEIGITERAVQRIMDELVEARYVRVLKSGRRNVYALDRNKILAQRPVAECRVEEILRLGTDLASNAKSDIG